MVQGGSRVDGKIWELIELHDQHPEAVEASLIMAGLRWRAKESNSPRRRAHAWQDIAAIIDTLPWDSPLHRAYEPDDWYWRDPKHDVLVSTMELVAATAAKTPNQTKAKKSDFVRVPRPWDKSRNTKRIGSAPLPIAELDAWLEGSFTPVTAESHGGTKDIAPDA